MHHLLLLITLSSAHPALADVAPGPLYREDCTVEQKEQDGTTCEACATWFGAASDSAEQTCEEQYAGTDFTYVCRTEGGSTWAEVWCDGPPREGCSCSTGPTSSGWLIAAAVVLGALRRRRAV